MYIKRSISPQLIWMFAKRPLMYYGTLTLLVYFVHDWLKFSVSIPFLPVATIGTAVAFYIGFKNNSAYDRLWEARRIWGSITNASRTFASWLINWAGKDEHRDDPKLAKLKQEMIYRHIAWVNVLRMQLRKKSVWENHYSIRITQNHLHFDPEKQFKEDMDKLTNQLLNSKEIEEVKGKPNHAIYLLQQQSKALTELKKAGYLSEFEHSDLEKTVAEFFNQQGASERIKAFPFPRQYGYFSTVFVMIFVILLPFALIGEIAKFSPNAVWLFIPFNCLISWIFLVMESIGDSSENPFENAVNDVPLTAICRNIEIDLRQMLGEQNLPEKIQPENGVLL